MSEQLKPGDTVMLRSGGPVMTIEPDGQGFTCIWFERAELRRAVFHPESLTHHVPRVRRSLAEIARDFA